MNLLQLCNLNLVNVVTFVSLNNTFRYLVIFIYLILSNNKLDFFCNFIFFYKINWNNRKKFKLTFDNNFFSFKFNNFFLSKFSFPCYTGNRILFKNFYLYRNLINFSKNNKNFIIKNKSFIVFNLLNLKFFFNFLNFYKNLFFFNFTFSLLCYPYFGKLLNKFNFAIFNNRQFFYKNDFTLNIRNERNLNLLFLNNSLI